MKWYYLIFALGFILGITLFFFWFDTTVKYPDEGFLYFQLGTLSFIFTAFIGLYFFKEVFTNYGSMVVSLFLIPLPITICIGTYLVNFDIVSPNNMEKYLLIILIPVFALYILLINKVYKRY